MICPRQTQHALRTLSEERVFSYFANKKLTFKVEDNNPKFVLRFAINIIVCYLVAYGVAKPLVRTLMAGYSQVIGSKIGMEPLAVEENVAILFGMGYFVILNCMVQKFFVFRNKEKESE